MSHRIGREDSRAERRREQRVLLVSVFVCLVSIISNAYIVSLSLNQEINTDPRAFAVWTKKNTAIPEPASKKKTAKPCAQWCAACGGFCADGENETCNALAASRCEEKPCYAAGPDGKSYLCTQVPVAKPAAEEPVVKSAPSAGCEGATSTCSCDPNPVCNTVLRDSYHSSCPEYCEAFAKKPATIPVVTDTIVASKTLSDALKNKTTHTIAPVVTVTEPTVRPEKLGDKCSTSSQDCGAGLACLATPYGHYCGVPLKTYQTLKNGANCDSVIQCSNACSGGFYRNPKGDFYCGKPPPAAIVSAVNSPQYPAKMGSKCSVSNNECGEGLACLTTPYGYYCGEPMKTYKSLKNGEKCDSIFQCSNACSGGFYRNTANIFYCGKPPAAGQDSANPPPVAQATSTTAQVTPQRTITQAVPTVRTPTSAVPAVTNVCNNPILQYAAVGDLGGDILPLSYVPHDLVQAKSYFNAETKIENPNTKISKSALPMFTCFEKEVMNEGYQLGIYDGGGFRDCEAQKAKNNDIKCGHSEHQTGLAMDLYLVEPADTSENSDSVRIDLRVNSDANDVKIQRLLNKAEECGLAHPITYDDPHFFAIGAVVEEKNMGNYQPIPRTESNMEQLNAVIRKQQAQCEQ